MVLLRNPDIMLFLARDAGILVLVELAKEMADRGTPTVDLSLARLGRRFAVSRTHVRQLLAAAETQELVVIDQARRRRSEEHTSELQSLMRISYAVFCLKKKKQNNKKTQNTYTLQYQTILHMHTNTQQDNH